MSDIDLAEAVEAAARALAGLASGEAWPTNEALGGGPASTYADDYRLGVSEEATEVVSAALPHIERQVREQERARILTALADEQALRNGQPPHVCDAAKEGFCHRDAWSAALGFATHVTRGDVA